MNTSNGRLGVVLLVLAVALAVGCGSSAGSASTVTTASTASTAAAPPLAGAATLQQAFVNVFKRVSPSVVQITTSEGLGSGIVFDAKETSSRTITSSELRRRSP